MDIYSSVTGTWATATLSSPRFGLASASVSSLGLALFAGGKLSSNSSSDVVDIYNGLTNRWATARLSLARFYLSAASLSMGNQSFVLFAGGFSTGVSLARVGASDSVNRRRFIRCCSFVFPDGATTNVVDIYNCLTQTMSIASLRSARGLMASASLDLSSIGAKSLAIFAGGATGTLTQRVADDTIEFFDGERWASSKLGHNKYSFQIATLDKEGLAIFAGGLIPSGPRSQCALRWALGLVFLRNNHFVPAVLFCDGFFQYVILCRQCLDILASSDLFWLQIYIMMQSIFTSLKWPKQRNRWLRLELNLQLPLLLRKVSCCLQEV